MSAMRSRARSESVSKSLKLARLHVHISGKLGMENEIKIYQETHCPKQSIRHKQYLKRLMKNVSRLQIVIILWLLSPLLFGTIEDRLLHPNNIWPNDSGTGLPLTSSVLVFPYLVLFLVLYRPLSWLPLTHPAESGSFIQFPNLNAIGTVLIGSLFIIILSVIGFWLGKRISYFAWQKYVIVAFSFILLFDISLFSLQTYSDINSERPLRIKRDSVLKQCNEPGPEFTTCMDQCNDQLNSRVFQGNEERNTFWIKCTESCNTLHMSFRATCLRKSGLPEYKP